MTPSTLKYSLSVFTGKGLFVARRKKKQGPTTALILAIVAGMLLLIVAGVGGYFLINRSKKDSAGAKGGEKDSIGEPPDEGPTYDTPQAVFDAAQVARERGDFREYARLLTRSSRELLVGMQAVLFIQFYELLAPLDKTGRTEKRFSAAIGVLERHGFTKDVRAQLAERVKARGISSPESLRAYRDAGGRVRDKCTFLGELAAALDGTEFSLRNTLDKEVDRLTDVQIDGDRATGSATWKRLKNVPNAPFSFAKENGGWKIDIPEGRTVRR